MVDESLGLMTIEGLGGTEVGVILVVGKDLYREWGPMEVVLPGLQSVDDTEEFPVVDVTVSFCRGEQLGKIRTRVPVTIYIHLEEDSARGVLGGVSCNGKRSGKVWEVEDRFGHKEGFEGVK